jgi:molybdenum cofactor biosynthesis protein MoaC
VPAVAYRRPGRRAWPIAGPRRLGYTGSAVRLYSFDVDGETLEQVPLAARRALDHAGRKLSLAGWTSLEDAERRALARLGSTSPVDLDAVARVLRRARPAPTNTEAIGDPPRDAPPPRVVEAYADSGRLSAAIWSSLSDVDRYALDKVARRPSSERIAGAYAEIIGHTQVSTHLRAQGGVQMVNVGAKAITERRAEAESRVSMNRDAFALLANNAVPKGDVLATARLAGIMAAKRTSDLIPLCHALPLSHIAVELRLDAQSQSVHIATTVETQGKTGVEMEALVAATHAALTVYDMLKGVDRAMTIGPTRLIAKSGGASGSFLADHGPPEPSSEGALPATAAGAGVDR